MALRFYTSVAKGLKLQVRKCWELIPKFVEVTGQKLVGGPFCPPSWIGLRLLHSQKENKNAWMLLYECFQALLQGNLAEILWLWDSKDQLSQYSTSHWSFNLPASVCGYFWVLFLNPGQDKDQQKIIYNQSKVGKYSENLNLQPAIPDIWCNVCTSEIGKQSSLMTKAEAKVQELCEKDAQRKDQRGHFYFIFVIWRRLTAATDSALFAGV